MLTTNIDIADRLITGQMGTVLKIGVNEITQKVSIVYILVVIKDYESAFDSVT